MKYEKEKEHNYIYTLHDTKELEQKQIAKKQKFKTEMEEMRYEMKEISFKLVKASEEINRMKTYMIEMNENNQFNKS